VWYHVIKPHNCRRDAFGAAGAVEVPEETLFDTAKQDGWKAPLHIVLNPNLPGHEEVNF
jgi:hypothetical protein